MKKLCLALVLSLTLLGWDAASGAETPVAVAANNPDLVFVGRFTEDKIFGWSASTIRMKVKATAVTAQLTLLKGPSAGFLAVIDGRPAENKIILSKAQNEYPIAENLSNDWHLIELVKTSEGGYFGEVQFKGFKLSQGGEVLPAAKAERTMMIIGDSISCGYGNEAKTAQEGNNVNNENAYYSYGLVAGRKLSADVVTICWSGHGLFRDRWVKDDQVETLPKVFDRTLPLSAQPIYSHSQFVPQVIVINLGTNDLNVEGGKKAPLTKEYYQNTCREFIKRLRTYYPESKIILAIGPMLIPPINGWQAELANEFQNVRSMTFQPKTGDEYYGGHRHPSVKMDQAMGETLANTVQDMMSWK